MMNSDPSFEDPAGRSESFRRPVRWSRVWGAVLLVAGMACWREPTEERLLRRSAEASRYIVSAAQMAKKYGTSARLRTKAVEAYFSGSREYEDARETWRRGWRTRMAVMAMCFAGAGALLAAGFGKKRFR